MANSKELVTSDSVSSPEFTQELLPSAERTALLYHLSYLSLGKFPQLERLIRSRALETQQLFGSSEAVLMKCAGTSENLVKSLLPFLKVAVEKNKPQLAQKFLDKAKEWIVDIINDVHAIVKRYDEHNRDVVKSTSDMINVKKKTEQKQQEQTNEMKTLQKNINDLEEKLHNINKKIESSEKKIEDKNAEIQKFINKITEEQTSARTSRIGSKVSLFSMMVPFVESVIDYVWKWVTSSSDEFAIKAFKSALSALNSEKESLKKEEWDIQNKLMDKQLQLAKLKIEEGQMPTVSKFDDVQKCLSRIQQILVQLQKFWEKVVSQLDKMKKETFAGENCVEELADLKEEFLESIDKAKEGWTKFGISCIKANQIFSVQSNQAYRFLEINPSSLSKEDWQKEYENVKEKLQNITTNTANKAITQ